MVNISPEGVTAPDGLHQHVGDLHYSLDISFFFLSSCLNVIFSLFATDLLHPACQLVKWRRCRYGGFLWKRIKYQDTWAALAFARWCYATAFIIVASSACRRAHHKGTSLSLRVNFQHAKALPSDIRCSLVALRSATSVVTVCRKKCRLKKLTTSETCVAKLLSCWNKFLESITIFGCFDCITVVWSAAPDITVTLLPFWKKDIFTYCSQC